MKIITLLFLFLSMPEIPLMSQKLYKANACDIMREPITGHLKMGDAGPSDKKMLINSLYMTIGGKPVLPVMGEIHFSRIKRDRWEDCILKMKACGINIISTYLFWNQHEEVEGQFNWEEEKDLRAFVQLCAKHEMYVIVRLGPWAHGEARNGGTPDWILRKKYIKDRSNDVVYQNYVRRYFSQIANQLKGLYYKDGGNIIGVQLENEYWHAKEGEAYIQWLKDTARSFGIDVPLYTVTGWGNGSVPPFEVIPLWGAYADAPWDQQVEKLYQPENFEFDSFRDYKNTNDQTSKPDNYMSYEKYPYFTCEVGIGVQNTYHRRLVISPVDGLGMMTAKLGSGSNLLGYYIFTGVTQFRGLLHSTEEEQEETGSWTRVPLKSYDFQTAIRESGEISPSYKEVKKLHYFINEAGSTLAPMMPVVIRMDKEDLQVAVRSDNNSGFLFGINYVRNIPKAIRKDCRFQVRFKNETILFPQQGIDIPDSSVFIWPLNYDLGGLKLKYATAQLLGRVDNCYLFFRNRNIPVELAFDPSSVEKAKASNGSLQSKNDLTILSGIEPGKQCIITILLKDGRKCNLIVLSEHEADNCWILDCKGRKTCFISDANMYADKENIYIYSTKPVMSASRLNTGSDVSFSDTTISAPSGKKVSVKIEPHSFFSDALWLETANFSDIPPNQQRYHRFFFKEFSLGNPSRFRKATLYIYPEADCQLNVNNTWVRQTVKAGELNIIDLIGYVSKAENLMFIDFPYTTGLKRFTARMIVEYYNYDRIDFCTDQSWLSKDMYTNPTSFTPVDHPNAPRVTGPPDNIGKIIPPGFSEWNISVPYGTLDDINNVYLDLKYYGDRAELYNGYTLSADNFNDNRVWTIGLNRQERIVEVTGFRRLPRTRSGVRRNDGNTSLQIFLREHHS